MATITYHQYFGVVFLCEIQDFTYFLFGQELFDSVVNTIQMPQCCPGIENSRPAFISTVLAELLNCTEEQWGIYPAPAGLSKQKVLHGLDRKSAGTVVEYGH